MSGRLRRAIARPLSERERRQAFTLVVAILLVAAASFMLSAREPAQHESPLASGEPSSPMLARGAAAGHSRAVSAPVMLAGRRFLADYLPYLYGQARAPTFRAASNPLRRRLLARAPHVSPAMRRRDPHIVHFAGHRLPERSRWVLTATIADGDAATYPIDLVIATDRAGRPEVVALSED